MYASSRLVTYAMNFLYGIKLTYMFICEDRYPKRLKLMDDDLVVLRRTMLCSVPHLYNRVFM